MNGSGAPNGVVAGGVRVLFEIYVSQSQHRAYGIVDCTFCPLGRQVVLDYGVAAQSMPQPPGDKDEARKVHEAASAAAVRPHLN